MEKENNSSMGCFSGIVLYLTVALIFFVAMPENDLLLWKQIVAALTWPFFVIGAGADWFISQPTILNDWFFN